MLIMVKTLTGPTYFKFDEGKVKQFFSEEGKNFFYSIIYAPTG